MHQRPQTYGTWGPPPLRGPLADPGHSTELSSLPKTVGKGPLLTRVGLGPACGNLIPGFLGVLRSLG